MPLEQQTNSSHLDILLNTGPLAKITPELREWIKYEWSPKYIQILAASQVSPKTITYIVKTFPIGRFYSNRTTPEDLAAKLGFINNHNLDPYLQNPHIRYMIININIQLLQVIQIEWGDNGWKEIINTPKTELQIRQTAAAGLAPSKSSLQAHQYQNLAQREEITITNTPDFSKETKIIQKLLRQTGLGSLAKLLCTQINVRLTPRAKSNNLSYSGNYGHPTYIDEYNELQTNPHQLDISLYTKYDQPHQLLYILLHEIGHAFHSYLAANKQFRFYCYQYPFQAARSPHQFSSYAEGYRLKAQRTSDRIIHEANILYYQESFAEDFRLLLLRPDLMDQKKRKIIEHALSRAFPEFDIKQVRTNIRHFIGNGFGRSINDYIRPTNPEKSQKIAAAI